MIISGHVEMICKDREKERYKIVIDLGRPGDKRKRIIRRGQGTKTEAKQIMSELIADLKRGTYIEPSKLTFGEYLTKWIEDYGKTRLSPTTYRRYKGIIDKRVIPSLGDIKLQQLKAIHFRTFYKELVDGKRLDKKEGKLSIESIHYHHRVIHKALESAFVDELIFTNPADRVELPKLITVDEIDVKEDIQVLTESQVDLMLDKAKETHYFSLLYTAVMTGLRRGELLGLRWQDLDLKEGLLSVKQTLLYTLEQGIFYKPPKTPKSRRVIDIPKEVVDVLKQHRKKQAEHRLVLGEEYKDRGLVFCQYNGLPIHPDTPSSWFPNFLEDNKLPRLNFHCLRHTHASLLLNLGEDIKLILERLGHSSVRTTYYIYSHLMPGKQKAAVDKLAQRLKK